jgi:uncharacterized protein YjiK
MRRSILIQPSHLIVALAAIGLAACSGGSSDAPTTLAFAAPTLTFTQAQNTYDLSNYSQVGRYSLPVGTGANLLAEEASGITYNKDTDTLFVVGDGSTSVTQVSKTGVLIDSMVLAADTTKPQGTYFYDVEGITYLGGGKFALVEERYRQINEFTYLPGTTLAGSGTRTVKLGTTIGNIGIEGMSYDPMTSGFVMVKESAPLGVFQTTVNFASGTASNGSATTMDSANLFDPIKTGLNAHNDVFALSNILPSTAPDYSHLILLSAPDGKIVKVDRAGNVLSSLLVGSIAQNEGVTMDAQGNIYVVGEQGGGPGRPELLVFSPTLNKTAVAVTSNLYLNFNQMLSLSTGNFTLSNGAGDTRTIAIGGTSQITLAGSTLTINPSTDLIAGTTYSVSYPAGLLKDAQGNPSSASSALPVLSFTAVGTTDKAAPTLVSSVPADNSTAITSSRVVLTFNEPVIAGTGNIIISNSVGDTRIINVTDTTQVTFSGNTANINPNADYLLGTTYNVQLPGGVIKDLAGNPFAGLNTATMLDFTMAAAPPTVLVAGDVLFMAANSSGATASGTVDSFAFVLLRAVGAGTTIGFTDKNYMPTAVAPAPVWPTNEALFVWTADVAYPAGTIVTVQPDNTVPIASKGTIQGTGGGLSATAETIYAFQGVVAGLGTTSVSITNVDRFLAAINVGGAAAGAIPSELVTAETFIRFTTDNAIYNGTFDRTNIATFSAAVKNAANWLTRDASAYPLTAGSLFVGE